MDRLAITLEQLTATMRVAAPEAFRTLRPGLDHDTVSRVESALGGLLLPLELQAFYRWHDGQGPGDGVLPGFQLDPLESVARGYPLVADFPRQWLGLGTMNGDLYLMAVCAFTPSKECPLIVVDPESDFVEVIWNSVASFVDSARECFGERVYRSVNGILQVDGDAQQRIWRRHSGPVVIDGQTLPDQLTISASDAWPVSWRTAAGIFDEDEVLRGATATLAELQSSVQAATIVGRVGWLAGTAGGSVIVVDDGTGQIRVAVPDGIVGRRYLRIRDRFEFDLEPGRCPEAFAFLPGSADVVAVATRIRRVR